MEQKSFLYSSSPDVFGRSTDSERPVAKDHWNLFPYRSATNKVESLSNASSMSSSSGHQLRPRHKIDASNSQKDQNNKRRSSFSSYRPRFQSDSNTKYQPTGRGSDFFASIVASGKEQSQADTCSPRVQNLQKEMDLLRTEIQRLKMIDINTYSTTKTRYRTTTEGQSSEMVKECKKWTTATNESMKMQLGDNRRIHDYEVLNSDDSETEEVETDDFHSFVEKLKQERIQSCNQSSGSASTEALEATGRKGQCFESGVQSNEVENKEYRKLKEQVVESQKLLYKQREDLQYLHKALQRKDSELRDWAAKWSEHERTKHQEFGRKQTHTTGVQCDDKDSQRDLIHTGNQCDSTSDILQLQSQVQTSTEECSRLQTIIAELHNRNDSLKEENHTLRKNESVREQLLENEPSERLPSDITSITEQPEEILKDMRLPQATIEEIIQRALEIKQTWDLNVEASPNANSIEDSSLNEQNLQLQEEMRLLKSTHHAELQHLNDEKESLMQKVVELRRLIKKEVADKEAAQAASAKHEYTIKDHYAEVEQSRVLVQQKKQQVSELEDAVAALQHENDNWERDYSILTRKNEKLERELRLARKLETNFSEITRNQA